MPPLPIQCQSFTNKLPIVANLHQIRTVRCQSCTNRRTFARVTIELVYYTVRPKCLDGGRFRQSNILLHVKCHQDRSGSITNLPIQCQSFTNKLPILSNLHQIRTVRCQSCTNRRTFARVTIELVCYTARPKCLDGARFCHSTNMSSLGQNSNSMSINHKSLNQ